MIKDITKWSNVIGYEDSYEVSACGRVRRKERYWKNKVGNYVKIEKKECNIWRTNYGYEVVNLCKNGQTRQFRVHRLVALSFIKNSSNKPFVNHINGIKNDNRVENLEWCTQSDNVNHAIENGFKKRINGESNPDSKLKESEVIDIRRMYETDEYTQLELSKIFNISRRNVNDIINNKIWKHV